MRRALALLALLPAAACARSSQDVVDLRPRTGWHAGLGVTVREDGRISLTSDGRGYVWKALTLDMDRYPILLVRTAQTLPRVTWSVAVQLRHADPRPPDEAVTLLRKSAEEGGYIVPFAESANWHGEVPLTLMVVLEGHAGDWIELADLQAVHVTDDPPPAPRLLLPAGGRAIEAEALHYEWRQVPNAVAYDLQVSPSAGFSPATTVRVRAPYLADKLPYLPADRELLGAGTWFWRVRSVSLVGRPGPWSPADLFTVSRPRGRRPRELAISAAHPLFLFVGDGRRLEEQWKAVPESLKPNALLRVEALPSETLDVFLDAAQRAGVPVAFQASGPHDYYGPVSSRIPLTEVERIFERYPVVKAVYICEQNFRVAPAADRIMRDYARRLIPLAASHGKTVLWADAHWGRNLWIDVGLDRALLDTIRAYPQYLVPIQKMNGALTPYSAHDAVLGLWVSGAVDNWGVQPERWYWYEAGLGKPGRYGWFKEGDMAAFPPAFYGEMALLGLSAGATVYSFEPGEDVFGPKGATPVAREEILPLLEAIAADTLVPGRDDVLREIRSVYVADSADARWSLDYGTLRPLYLGSYGIAHPFDLIPASGRYYWIPILPRWTPAAILSRFPDRLASGSFADSGAARRHLEARSGAAGAGTALVLRAGRLTVVQNSDANGGTTQKFDLGPALAGRVAGRVGPHGYAILDGGRVVFSRNVVLDAASR